MPALGWYVHRLRTMTPGELAWRVLGSARDAEVCGRVALAREPTPRPAEVLRDAARSEPGFRVCDVAVGEWARVPSGAERCWRHRLVDRADRIARHRLSFFHLVDHDLGDPIDWNRDHGTGARVPLGFAPLIDYRDAAVAGDAKVVWEPNRHHQLVVLARAYRATGEQRYAAAVIEQLDSWLAQCPFGRGMNWRSPLELAVRLVNWVWAIDLVRESALVAGAFLDRLRLAAYRHLWLITRSYSRGSSANNHRIGEAAGVLVASAYFQGLDPAGRWRRESREVLAAEILSQTHADGGSREQAVGYQIFVLQFFVVAGLVARATGEDFPREYWARLEQMLEFLAALAEGGAAPPMLGDADDGYLLDLGEADRLRALFSTGAVLFDRRDFKALAGACAEDTRWLLGRSSRVAFDALPPGPAGEVLVSRALRHSGYYVLQSGHRDRDDRISVVFDCGDLGFGAIAAHGHADALAFTLRAFGRDVLVDPGTYDYFTFPAWRRYFRSTPAHNTVVVDGQDQSVMAGPFLWGARARARCLAWEPRIGGGRVQGEHDGYRRLPDPVVHRRTLDLDGPAGILTIRDEIVADGTHEVAACFHLAEDLQPQEVAPGRYTVAVGGGTVTLEPDPRLAVVAWRGSEEPISGWVSHGYHRKAASTTLIARARCTGRATFTSRVVVAR